VPVLAEESRNKLRDLLQREASVGNPVDMIASASAEQYRETIRIVAHDENIDSVIVIFVPPLVTRPEDVARSISEEVARLDRRKPVIAVFMSPHGAPAELNSGPSVIPNYRFPETAAIALARAARYQEWRDRPELARSRPDDIRSEEAAALVATALERGDSWLTPEETAELLSCYGLPLVEQQFVETPEQAAVAATAMQGAVVLKAVAPGLIHKTEVDAVHLNLRGAEAVRAAALHMHAHLESVGQTPTGFIVQRMAEKGVEMILGVVHDPQFGPVIACGAGGIQVELMRDVSVRLTPISQPEAAEMIRALKTYPLLSGFRGSPHLDVAALEDALMRISMLVDDIPQIAELDCNPFVVGRKGGLILDARVRVVATQPRPLIGVRQ